MAHDTIDQIENKIGNNLNDGTNIGLGLCALAHAVVYYVDTFTKSQRELHQKMIDHTEKMNRGDLNKEPESE